MYKLSVIGVLVLGLAAAALGQTQGLLPYMMGQPGGGPFGQGRTPINYHPFGQQAGGQFGSPFGGPFGQGFGGAGSASADMTNARRQALQAFDQLLSQMDQRIARLEAAIGNMGQWGNNPYNNNNGPHNGQDDPYQHIGATPPKSRPQTTVTNSTEPYPAYTNF